ncbi:MAG TPA: double-strand break repair helicase AddA [Novosphingobium sp.]|nr:double-strand break repair helicase AddA [Novosphingobium sp.]
MSGGAPDKVHPLHGNQMRAVAPDETVWLSASAGTGKTQVLSARVLRLLLQPGVTPSQILCLTFTKAGATEMAARINDKLARWVRLDDPRLAKELDAIGADIGPDSLARARTLFAAVLDCPGGGLRIDTIHAFSQWLLAAFPHEADLVPGTRPMEDRERTLLARQVLADLLIEAQNDSRGGPLLLDAVANLSLRMGPEQVENWLLRCAEAREAWFGPGSWREPMRPRVLRLLGLPSDAEHAHVAVMCSDDVFDVASLRRCMEANRQWGTKTGLEAAAIIADWMAGDRRAEALEVLRGVFMTQKGEPRSSTAQGKIDPDYSSCCDRVIACIEKALETQALLMLTDWLVPSLRLGRAFAVAWDEAKHREGVIDFDDQIRRAAALLGTSSLSEWIRYKLDRRFDHVLIDEAQDTNAAQWRIIDALTGDFFAGSGQHRGDVMRTLFVVGDYKQAIFRFQGTSPENFRSARDRVRDQMFSVAENALVARSDTRPRPLREYGLDRSFRTAQPVLDFVDQAIAGIGPENFGLDKLPDTHVGEQRPGYVGLWRPIGAASDDVDGDASEGDPGWLSGTDRELAERIALQIKVWTDPEGEGFRLVKGQIRRATAGDVMVLVRKRRELAGLIVARLHAHKVPVAGVDRLRLGAPLAVKDLMAALRFAAQPLDDLNLAALLVSPLIGWSQQQLLDHGWRERGRLWSHLRTISDPLVARTLDQLGGLLALADYEPPQQLLHWLLVGPWQGRRKLVARLGREANDPIDELLNAAHAYATGATPSLAGFINWFDAGEGELKRDAETGGGFVRVMTVHGSKGLQAPIVVLADATGNPDAARPSGIDLPDPPVRPGGPVDRAIPLPPLRKDERRGRISEQAALDDTAEAQEHWRLLYVAMTRAEEALFIGGALGPRDRGEPAENSWYAKLRALFPTEAELADPIWSGRLDHGDPPQTLPPEPLAARSGAPQRALDEPLPPWLAREPAAEPRPSRPLAPSSLGEEQAPDPPYPPGAGGAAAKRGTLAHKLLERLPQIPPETRREAATRWLERNAANMPANERDAILTDVLKVIADPAWAELFSPDALAEVPIAATLGDRVIAGTIDRLLVEPDRVLIVDFKTARRPPESVHQIPRAILRQMAAYAAALERIYPGRRVEAAVLYTAAPRLIALTDALLDEHKRALAQVQ